MSRGTRPFFLCHTMMAAAAQRIKSAEVASADCAASSRSSLICEAMRTARSESNLSVFLDDDDTMYGNHISGTISCFI